MPTMPSDILLAAGISAALLIGFLTTLLESIKPALARRHGLAPAGLPPLDRWLQLSWLFLMPLAGWAVDAWGVHGVLFAGSLILSFGVAWFAVASSVRGLIWSVLGLGVGGAALTLAGLRLMPVVFAFGHSPTPTGAFCIGFALVAAAALVTLGVYPALIDRLGFRNTVLVTALLCLAPAAVASFAEDNLFPIGRPDPMLEQAFARPHFWLLVLLIFFWFPIEHSLDVWPKPFLGEVGYEGRSVGYVVAGFWFWFLASRLAMGWVFEQGFEIWLVFALALIPPMVLGNLVGAYAPSSGYFGFWLMGAAYGPMLPAFFGITMTLFDARAFFLGLLLSVDSLCALLIRPWFTKYLSGHTARQAMRIPLAFGLLLAGAILMLALIWPR